MYVQVYLSRQVKHLKAEIDFVIIQMDKKKKWKKNPKQKQLVAWFLTIFLVPDTNNLKKPNRNPGTKKKCGSESASLGGHNLL